MSRPKESYRGFRRNHARFLKLPWAEYQRMWPLKMVWKQRTSLFHNRGVK